FYILFLRLGKAL
ncbi:serine hydroxymethyltransferase domain protein, partial [Chlamydia psittaci 06-1683]